MWNWLSLLLRSAPVSRWALIFAGPAMSAFAGGLVWIVWKGGWGADRAEQQLFYLGSSLLAVIAVIAVVIVSLASAKVRVQGPGGFSGEIESERDETFAGAPAKMTTTVEVKA